MFPPPYGLAPDFDAMKKSWRQASSSQKAVRIGIVGGFLGGLVYLLTTGRHPSPPPPGSELPPEPVERDPSAPPTRGRYR